MGSTYPELKERETYIKQITSLEEQRFQETLTQGMDILEGYVNQIRAKNDQVLPGDLAFKLYDTYGFPLDLTAEILEEKDMTVDREGFDQKLQEQQTRGRAAARAGGGEEEDTRYRVVEHLTTTFTGYETIMQEASLLLMLIDGQASDEAKEDQAVEVILDYTPFYAEAGGQIGDTGIIESTSGRIKVENTFFTPFGQIVHQGQVEEGSIKVKESVMARVDDRRRQGISRSHTSTHLLHRALRNTLGEHVNQAGSLVAPDRLRFDFNHFAALNAEELQHVEEEVNKMVLENVPVRVEMTTLEKAEELGATAIFTEKYEEDAVRMVSAGDYTRELCGGTHVSASGEIGLFKIVTEEGIGSGLRRIEAVVGLNAYRRTQDRDRLIEKIAGTLHTVEDRLDQKFDEHIAGYKALQKSFNELKQRLAASEVKTLLSEVTDVDGINVLSARVSADNQETLRLVMDEVKNHLSSVIVVLGAVSDGKVILVASATSDLVNRGIRADQLLKEVARQVGGGGGGKPELAQAGGKDPQALPAALESAKELVQRQLKAASQ